MDEYDVKSNEWINARERFMPKKIVQPRIDMLITKIVGKPVYNSDPRLIKLIVKYKKHKNNENEPDDFIHNPKFIKELHQVFSQKL